MTRRWSKITIIALVLAVVAVAGTQAAGYYYEAVTVNEGERKRQSSQMRVRAWIDGPMAKIEFVDGEKKGFFAAGSYLVTKDAGETVYLVNPEERTYAEFDLEKMLAAAGQVMEMMSQSGEMLKMEFSDISNEKLLEESGGSVLGHSTTHYRFKTGYTMKMAVMGFKQENRTEMVQDVWSTTDYDAAGFGVWLRPDRRFRTGHEGLDELMSSEWSNLSGFPLKTVVASTTTNKKGKSMQVTSTTEVTALREESVAETVFEVPEGYTETQIMPEVAAGDDQEAGEDKKKKGLSGLFKKPDG